MKNKKAVRNVQILKGMVIFGGIILIIFGIAMIFKGVKGQESITIKTPLVEGGAETNYVGLAAIFLGAIIILGAVLKTYYFSSKKRVFESGGLKITEEEEIDMTRSVDEKGSEE
ncbi:MAG: hypothetical protein ACYS19_12230 [Planctomycetota bacterium]|jgi:hypothetical protein